MLNPKLLNFLTDLKNNNSKEWFEANRSTYDYIKSDFVEFYDDILKEISKFEPRIAKEPERARRIFRINRDVRFSKDKTPYKSNFGGAIVPGGMDSGLGGYYIHIEPGNCGVAGGMWQLTPKSLERVRRGISRNFFEFLDVINDKDLQKTFGGLEKESSLKRVPTGFDKDDDAAEFLKLRKFTVWKVFKDEEISEEDFLDKVVFAFKQVKKLNDFLDARI